MLTGNEAGPASFTQHRRRYPGGATDAVQVS